MVKGEQRRHVEQLCGPGLLLYIFRFLGHRQMPALSRVSWCLRQQSEDDSLWHTFFTRRCWGGVMSDPDEFTSSSLSLHKEAQGKDQLNWRDLYRIASRIEARQVHRSVRYLQRVVPGVRGPLGQLVGIVSENHRAAASCGLRQNPILVDRLSDGFACMEELRAADFKPRKFVFISLEPENEREQERLDGLLRRLRALGGTCTPLLDCFSCPLDGSVEPSRLFTALRKAVGATAICEGTEEAERVVQVSRCDVICCGGTRLAEYRKWEIPEVRWKEWPSGHDLWEP